MFQGMAARGLTSDSLLADTALDEAGYRDYLLKERGSGDSAEGLHDLCAQLEKVIAA